MARASQLEAAVGRQHRRDAGDELREAHLGLDHVELGRRIDAPVAARSAWRGTRRSACRRMRWTSSRSCCSSATISLLISTVLSGSRYRLAPLPELPWMMPGIDAAMLGLDDEHVAAVAVADDLVLQIARGVLAAQIRFERRSQPRPLLPQLRRGSRDSSGLALSLTSPDGSILLRTSAIWFLNDPQFSAIAFSVGKGPLTRRIAAHVSATESRNSANASSRSGSSARPSTASAESTASRSAGAFSENAGFASRYLTPSVVAAEQLGDAVRIGLRLELGQTGRAERRQREAAHDLDDAIPLECAKVHRYASLNLTND